MGVPNVVTHMKMASRGLLRSSCTWKIPQKKLFDIENFKVKWIIGLADLRGHKDHKNIINDWIEG